MCRTDPEASKHAGITVFLVRMDAPGVTVRPIRQMTGGSSFNEVYLDDVVVPDTDRLGEVGQGWRVTLTVLAAERLDSGSLGLGNADRAIELARHLPRPLTGVERHRAADLFVRTMVQRIIGLRVTAALVAGREPGRRRRWASSTRPRRCAGPATSCSNSSGRAWPPTRGVGHLRLDRAPARCTRVQHRGRYRRDPAQHPRRARARTSQGGAMTVGTQEEGLISRVREVFGRPVGDLEPLPGGHSGLTYRVTAGDNRYVVKAVPPRERPVGRNDMLRQARVLRALDGSAVPVPAVVAVDEEAPAWFAMEFVEGRRSNRSSTTRTCRRTWRVRACSKWRGCCAGCTASI
ncbi:phosphotransferase [Saccharopolyspora spinosporotrichia]